MRSHLFLTLAVCIVGVYLIVQSQAAVSSTLELIFGIVVLALAALDLFGFSEKTQA